MPVFFRERAAKHFGYSASSEVRWIQRPRDIGGFEAEPSGDDPVRNASKTRRPHPRGGGQNAGHLRLRNRGRG
jgi:hypothetical protein